MGVFRYKSSLARAAGGRVMDWMDGYVAYCRSMRCSMYVDMHSIIMARTARPQTNEP